MCEKKPSYEELLSMNEQLKQKVASFEEAREQEITKKLGQFGKTFETCYLPTEVTRPPINTSSEEDLDKFDFGTLTNEEIKRYSRQLVFAKWGVKSQLRIRATKILVVGAGGLGSGIIPQIAGAGFGCIGIVDNDVVDVSNLHRQTIHPTSNVGINKAVSAALRVRDQNPLIKVIPYPFTIDQHNVLAFVRAYDLIVDATDNVIARYLLSDACVLCDKPLVSAGAIRLDGQLTVYHYKGGPCYRCMYPLPPDPHFVYSCVSDGILPVTPNTLGGIEALEALKVAANIGQVLSEKMLLFSGISASFRQIKIRPRQESCAVCGKNPTITAPIDYQQWCGKKVSFTKDDSPTFAVIKSDELRQKILSKEYTSENTIFVDVRPKIQTEIAQIKTIKDNFKIINMPLHEMKKMTLQETLFPQITDNVTQVIFLSRNGGECYTLSSFFETATVDGSIKQSIMKRCRVLYGGYAEYASNYPQECPAY